MRKKIENATQASIMLPAEMIDTAKRIARTRAVERQTDVHWSDVVREVLAERLRDAQVVG